MSAGAKAPVNRDLDVVMAAHALVLGRGKAVRVIPSVRRATFCCEELPGAQPCGRADRGYGGRWSARRAAIIAGALAYCWSPVGGFAPPCRAGALGRGGCRTQLASTLTGLLRK